MKIECGLCHKRISSISHYATLKNGCICDSCIKQAGLAPAYAEIKGYYPELDKQTVESFNSFAEQLLQKRKAQYFVIPKELTELESKFKATESIPNILEIDFENKIVKLLSVQTIIPGSVFSKFSNKSLYLNFNNIKTINCLEEKDERIKANKKEKYCSRMYIRIDTNVLEFPIALEIDVNAAKPRIDSTNYNELKIKQNEVKEFFEDKIMNVHKSSDSNNSAADEIRKFKGLLDDGIITQEEFDAKKKQLLGL